jgi:hypothetical protein
MFKNVMKDDEGEEWLDGNGLEAVVSRECNVGRRLDAVCIPPAVLESIEKLAVTASNIKCPGTGGRRVERHMRGNRVEQELTWPYDR